MVGQEHGSMEELYRVWDKSKYFKFWVFLEDLDDFPTNPGKSE